MFCIKALKIIPAVYIFCYRNKLPKFLPISFNLYKIWKKIVFASSLYNFLSVVLRLSQCSDNSRLCLLCTMLIFCVTNAGKVLSLSHYLLHSTINKWISEFMYSHCNEDGFHVTLTKCMEYQTCAVHLLFSAVAVLDEFLLLEMQMVCIKFLLLLYIAQLQ